MDLWTLVIVIAVLVVVFSVPFTLPMIIASYRKKKQNENSGPDPAEPDLPGNHGQRPLPR